MHSHDNGFHGLGIAPKLLAILAEAGFERPTPIQQQCIPLAIEGNDVVGIAQTGTGKTLAFGIPIIQSLSQQEGEGLILVPTRELAYQVHEALQTIASYFGLQSVVLIGGEPIDHQIKILRSQPQVLIATPGRLNDHLMQKTISLRSARILILDEADRMLDMGFLPQIKSIIPHLPVERQTMLFSATMPPEIVNIATRYMKLPMHVEVAPSGTAAKDVSQELFFVSGMEKNRLLEGLLGEYRGSVLVFTKTKFAAKKLARSIRNAGHRTIELHSDRSLNQRREALEGFKLGKYRVLVATDIAARGIDVTGIELVVNYDLPTNPQEYVHRIGRTGRAGAVGHAISFAMPHQRSEVKAIEKLIRTAVKVSPLPEFDGDRAKETTRRRRARRPRSAHKPA
jgi:ATP-dependent RNA helicase RhlE